MPESVPITNPPNCSEITYWEQRYEKNQIAWHISEVHPQLFKNLDLITGSSPKKFFIPLCGKTVDIPYLLSKGHQVFGIDAVLAPILELNEEHSLKMKFDEEESIYYTEDKKLVIYYGDFYKCPIEKFGPFDCVFDRGSFVAIDYESRQDYARVMKKSLQNPDHTYHNFQYLMSTVSYDRSLSPGPPKAVSAEDIEKFFSSWAEVEVLESILSPIGSASRRATGNLPDETYEVTYLFKPKSK